MENEQNPFPTQQVIIEQNQMQQNEENMEDESSSEDHSDELLPKPAFIIEENENLTQDERDAMDYILSVRNQKQDLLKKKIVVKNRQEVEESSTAQNKIDQGKSYQDKLGKLLSWKQQTINNWKLVVQNLKYLQKTAQQQQYFKQKLSQLNFTNPPQVYKLCLNKSLNLSQIQSTLIKISNDQYENIQTRIVEKQHKSPINYHLWLYSLLALHQNYASYTNFQALASINSAIEREYSWFLMAKKSQTIVQIEKEEIVRWMINLILLIQVFKQSFLKKCLNIIDIYQLV